MNAEVLNKVKGYMWKFRKSKQEKRIQWGVGIFLIVLFVQTMLVVSAGIHKEGYFVDELWAYGLANSYYHPHVYSEGIFEKDEYLSPDYFKDYLEVSKEDAFQYDSVFYNQSMDSHPPLFYCVLHTVCSLFLNSFSKWYGIIPNIIYFTIARIGLYLLSKKIFHNEYMALFPVICWGFSIQAVSYAILIRMYMLFAMFVVLDSLLHQKYLSYQGKWETKYYIILFFVNLGGFLTQYYYYIFAFFLSASTAILLMVKKQWINLLKYCGTMLLSVISALVIFPGIIHTFLYERGAEALNNFSSGRSWLELLDNYLRNFHEKMVYGANKWIIILSLFAVCILLIKGILSHLNTTVRELLHRINLGVLSLWIAFFAYMAVMIKIAPYIADRYYFSVTPIFWLLIVHLIYIGMSKLKYGVLSSVIILSMCTLGSLIQGYGEGKVMYQYPSQLDNMNQIKNFKGSSCIYITNGKQYAAAVHALEFQNFSEIKIIDINCRSVLDTEIHNESSFLVVYIDDTLNQEEIIAQIFQKTGYRQYLSIGRGSGIGWEDEQEVYIYAFR